MNLANRSRFCVKRLQMKTKESKNQNEEPETVGGEVSETLASENFTGELHEPRWSVVSFETRAAKNLTYPEAERQIAELEKRGVSGLCLITDEAAERLSDTKAA